MDAPSDLADNEREFCAAEKGLRMAGRSPPDAPLDVLAQARAAGLDKAVEQFPDCVADAARAAAQDRNDMPEIDSVTEPWPPMRIRSAR
jgi:hypothetical protein